MPESFVLSAVGVSKGAFEKNGKQGFTVIASDFDNNLYYVSFVCEQNYSDSIEKALRRLKPVTVKDDRLKEEAKSE